MIALALLVAANLLSLDDALQSAREHQPQIRQAQANTAAASARAREALAPMLPQVSATAGYGRQIATGGAAGGGTSGSISTSGQSFVFPNTFSDSATASLLLFDFLSQFNRLKSAQASADAQAATERATALQVDFNVRAAYFDARANRALVKVAQETLDNQLKHLAQTEGFVQAGTHAEIDLVQARTDTANARVALINAENTYQTSKVTLNAAMGLQGPTDYEVADVQLQPLQGEDLPLERLLEEADQARPEIQSLEQQIRAAQLTVSSFKDQYWPSLGASAGFFQSGPSLDELGWRLGAGVTLTWNIYQGGLTRAQVNEAQANVTAALAQLDLQRLQVRADVDAARLAVRAAKESLSATQEALLNARERLRLAEERYQLGVGSGIELGDAQLALTQAAAQAVQADDRLATARAQLLRALGRQ
ncbi:MAG TPA: TolC family protein [Myxococcales bacterium]|nr:TolC family protein [Myxococcales bacterium]